MRNLTVHTVFLVAAVVLFLYAAVLVDHGADLPGNATLITDVGLAAFAASFIPWVNSR